MAQKTKEKWRRRRAAWAESVRRERKQAKKKEAAPSQEEGADNLFRAFILLVVMVLGFLFLSWLGDYAERVVSKQNHQNYHLKQEK